MDMFLQWHRKSLRPPKSTFLYRLLIRNIPPINTSSLLVLTLVAGRILARYFEGSQTFAVPLYVEGIQNSTTEAYNKQTKIITPTKIILKWSKVTVIIVYNSS
jgi:hypothetical protein